ncbi:MAG: citrate lyase holo-[acyl-carrier protein] synthase [Oscillospiraceae bacterium]
MDKDLEKVLIAREERWNKRQELAKKCNSTIISITLCVPQKFRTAGEFKDILNRLTQCFISQLSKMKIQITLLETIDGDDGTAIFCASKNDCFEVKRACVNFEEQSPACRILDIDVMDKSSNPISRKDIDKPSRRCFVCENDAAVCVSRKLHTKSEVGEKVLEYQEMAIKFIKETQLN